MGKLKKFMTGAGMYAVALLLAKLIGALYRIPLTNIIGAEGMGLYQMVFPLYTMMLTISSGGLPVAVSRMVAVRLSGGDERGANRVLVVAALFFSAVGLAASFAVFLFAGPLASAQGNAQATIAYIGIAPAILFVSVISAFRGYFQGRQNMLPSALSQLAEQGFKLVLGLTFALLLLPRGLEWGVLGALLGITLSEAAAMLVLLTIFIFGRRRTDRRHLRRSQRALLFENAAEMAPSGAPAIGAALLPDGPSAAAVRRKAGGVRAERTGDILKQLLKTALPVTLGSLILPVTQVADSLLIINLLVRAGSTTADATTLFGLYNGVTMAIVNMPVVLISAFSVALMPRIVRLFETGRNIDGEIAYTLKVMLVIAAFFLVLIAVSGGDIIRVLYKRGLSAAQIDEAAVLLALSAPIILFMSLIHVSTAVLQGLNRAAAPALYLMLGAIVKIAVTAALLTFIGIYGALIGTVACYFVTAFFDVVAVKKRGGFSILALPLWKVFLSAAAFAAVSLPLTLFLPLEPLWRLVIATLLGGGAFLGVLLPLGFFERHEFLRLWPFKDRRRKKYLK